MHCEFEAKIQWECAKSAIEIIRDGDLSICRVGEAVQHVSCFAGCLAKLVCESDGNDKPFLAGSTSPLVQSMTPSQLCDAIDAQIPSGDLAQAIDWQSVWKTVLPLILALIQKLLVEEN